LHLPPEDSKEWLSYKEYAIDPVALYREDLMCEVQPCVRLDALIDSGHLRPVLRNLGEKAA
jgi:hypothetical protein